MAQFVQIGDEAFNPEHIIHVTLVEHDGSIRLTRLRVVSVFFTEGITRQFENEDFDSFMRWWEESADVQKAV